MMREYYTIKEAAYLLGVSKATVLYWITKGQLKAYKVKSEAKKEWNFDNQVDMSNDCRCCYAISPEWLDMLDISNSLLTDNKCTARDRQELDGYLDYLDKRYADLCSELDEIAKIQNRLREIKPYL